MPPGSTKTHREQREAIRAYLLAIKSTTATAPAHIRKDSSFYEGKIEDLDAKLAAETDPLKVMDLAQERKTWVEKYNERLDFENVQDPAEFEAGFIKHAAAYAERKGLDFDTFVFMGVPREVLAKAKILEPA